MLDSDIILFDMDGTLVDHFNVIHRCFNYAIQKVGGEAISYDLVKATIGGSMPVTMAKLIGNEKAPEAIPHFNEHFDEIYLDEVHLLEGSVELLDELRAMNKRLGVFTNKHGYITRSILSYLKIDHYFEHALGAGDTPFKKPEIAFSRKILSLFDCSANAVSMIGDSPFDYEAAICVGMEPVLVTTGSHTQAQLREDTGCPLIFSGFIEILESLKNR